MPARVINHGRGGKKPQIKAPALNKEGQMKEIEQSISQYKTFTQNDRAQFYAGQERLDLQSPSVQRVRELQEENDHLQREISAKEAEITNCTDPLAILADIEHRKVILARNTGEILKIYLKNEERLKRISELQSRNARIEKELSEMQGQFIATKNMEEKTKYASEFFLMKNEIESNLSEIEDLNRK